jgi:hypothetical protein
MKMALRQAPGPGISSNLYWVEARVPGFLSLMDREAARTEKSVGK